MSLDQRFIDNQERIIKLLEKLLVLVSATGVVSAESSTLSPYFKQELLYDLKQYYTDNK